MTQTFLDLMAYAWSTGQYALYVEFYHAACKANREEKYL